MIVSPSRLVGRCTRGWFKNPCATFWYNVKENRKFFFFFFIDCRCLLFKMIILVYLHENHGCIRDAHLSLLNLRSGSMDDWSLWEWYCRAKYVNCFQSLEQTFRTKNCKISQLEKLINWRNFWKKMQHMQQLMCRKMTLFHQHHAGTKFSNVMKNDCILNEFPWFESLLDQHYASWIKLTLLI